MEDTIKKEIITIGKRLYVLRLVAAKGGNLSARVDENNILITATSTSLGDLKQEDIVKVDLSKETKDTKLSTEFPLHSLIYRTFPNIRGVIHCHPPLSNAYFSIYNDIKILTFETKLFLGDVPVVTQSTPSITDPQLVIDNLKSNNIVAIKNHGVVAIAEKFTDAFHLIEELEEAVKMVGLARLLDKESLDSFDSALKDDLSGTQSGVKYEMFSKEHIQAIVDAVNKDDLIAQKGKELGLTVQLAIKLQEDLNKIFKFNFENGRIVKLEFDDNAPFVISASADVWRLIFLGKLDPFVATTQGKMKLKGELGKLSQWYVPFSRLFELFKKFPIK